MTTNQIPRIPNGTTVTVRHDLGFERGTVLSSSNVFAGETQRRYTIQFADGTISSWNSNSIQSALIPIPGE